MATPLPILCSVRVVSDRVAGLPHVGETISDFVDNSRSMSIAKATRAMLPFLFQRLLHGAASSTYIDALCDRFHGIAAANGMLAKMVILDRLFPGLVISEAVAAAARNGRLNVLKWLYSRRTGVCWRADIVVVAAGSGDERAVKFLIKRFPPTLEAMYEMLLLTICRRFNDITAAVWPAFVAMSPPREWLNNLTSHASVWIGKGIVRDYRVVLSEISIDRASLRGDIAFIIWAQNHCSVATTMAMDSAATYGHLDVVEWLHYNRSEGCTAEAMDGAAAHGHFDIVRWLHENRTEGCTGHAFFLAAIRGHLPIAKWLYRTIPRQQFPPNTFDHVCANGRLQVARWLTSNGLGGGTTDAMDWAAAQNHFEVVQWLHLNRTEGCTILAMDAAASHGHLDVVRWLFEHRTEQCSENAMDHAAGNGHFEVLLWFDENRLGSFTTAAMDNAARGGHLDVIRWLHAHVNTVGCTTRAMDNAAANGHLHVVKWLHHHRGEGGTFRGLDSAAMNGKREVLEFFRQNRGESLADGAFRASVRQGDLHTARWIDAHFNSVVDTTVAVDHARFNGWASGIMSCSFSRFRFLGHNEPC